MDKKTEEEIAKEKKLEVFTLEEAKRTTQEKYRVKRIEMWGCTTQLLTFAYLCFFLYEAYLTKKINWVEALPLLMFLPSLVHYDFDEDWSLRLQAKEAAQYRNPLLNDFFYDEGYVYFDSKWNYLAYLLSRIFLIFVSLVVFLILGIILIAKLWNIEIDKMTVVIILLVIVIYNQLKTKSLE